MTLYLPISTPQPDRYYKIIDKESVDLLKKQLDRDDIHIFKSMHLKIAYFQFVGVLMLMYVGFVFGNFWQGKYFSWGPPVLTRDVNIDVPWKYWLLISVIAWDRIFAKASSYVIGNWRVNVVQNKDCPVGTSETYAKSMFILLTDHAVNWFRYSIMLVFLYSQIDFALAFAIPDIIIDVASGFWSASNLVKKYKAEDKDLACVRTNPIPVDPTKKLPKEVSGWGMSPYVVTFFQWIEVLLFVLVFYFTGYFDSPYFHFGAPFPMFGKLMKNNNKYGWFIAFVFVDQVLSSLHTSIVGPYVLSYLLNNSTHDIIYTETGARFIYISKKFLGWMRVIFLLFFVLSQFSFLLAMFLGDFLVTIYMLNRILCTRYDPSKHTRWFSKMPLSEMKITIVMIVEMTIIVIIAMAQLRIYKLPYFNWPPPLVLFDIVIYSGVSVAFIILYSVIDRIIYAFTTEITYPYIANVITGCDPDGLRYEFPDLILILFMDSSSNWIRRIVGFNFLLSNIALVIFQGFADIVCCGVILEHYLEFKRRIAPARAAIQYALDNERKKQQQQQQQQANKTIVIPQAKPVKSKVTARPPTYYDNYFNESNKYGAFD